MSASGRQLIRRGAVERLNLRTRAEDRVYPTRAVNWARVTLPAISVSSLEEAVDAVPGSASDALRVLQLAVLAVVSVTDAVDDELDEICVEVEDALDGQQLAPGVSEVRLASTLLDVGEESGRPVGVAKLTYEVRYQREV